MSTNYYLDSPDNKAGHIGKWAAGRFIAKAQAGIDTYDQWVAMLQGHRIFAEHGIEYTPDQMVQEITPTEGGRRNLRAGIREQRGDWVEHGVAFVRCDFR